MRFADPWLLLLLAVPAALAVRLVLHRRRPPEERIGFPVLGFLASEPATSRGRWRLAPDALRLIGLALVALALARPQAPHEVREVRSKARNLMLALDISSSMKATDFKPGNRLEVARQVLGDFARRREGDLLGLVIFAGRSFLQAPLTPDTELLQELLGRVEIGQLPTAPASARRSLSASASSRTSPTGRAPSCSSRTAPTTPARPDPSSRPRRRERSGCGSIPSG